jgi:hypothetical protein
MDIDVKIDMGDVMAGITKRIKKLTAALEKAEEETALATQLKLNDLADQHMHSGKEKYKSGIEIHELEKGYRISLSKEAEQFEEGRGSYNMLPGLLANGTTGKKGTYKIIPFTHGKSKSETTAEGQLLNRAIQNKMTSLKMGKIDEGKMPRGLLDRKVTIQPKTPNNLGKPTNSSPLLQNTVVRDQRASTYGKVSRSVMTFRTASSSQMGIKWMHPGIEGKHLMPLAKEFAEEELKRRVQEAIDKVMQ